MGKDHKGSKSRAAAIAVACCMLLMLSGQQRQVAAEADEFCQCYQHCYPGCRHNLKLPPWGCVLFCIELECRPIPDSAATCKMACGLDNLCGLSTGKSDDVTACMSSCNKKRSHY